ncbi:MAG: NAD(P)H-dependent oxidoreductase [Schleiferiaceae bacterium]|jgi:NAD(P)H-dependent FMN reductase|nr:NAD(P)H-dependent oxidoreductase [Schleiferiaceae bacterium]
MKKLIAFGASNSKQSVNQKLASYAANMVSGAEVDLLDLNDYEMPIYSVDREIEFGLHDLAMKFKEKINSADGIIISLAEYNGNITSAFKNIIDWVSRVEQKLWSNKPVLLLSASPGPRGGAGAMGVAKAGMPYQGANIVGSFSLPSYGQNFSEGEISNKDLKEALEKELKNLEAAMNEVRVEA